MVWMHPMNYQVTEHYARGEENLLAEFCELDLAKLFAHKKSHLCEDAKKKIIYRVYEQGTLLQELNSEHLTTAYANYLDGQADIDDTTSLVFQVMVKAPKAVSKQTIAQFKDQKDAHLFVASQFKADDPNNDTKYEDDLFFIFKGKVSIGTKNKAVFSNFEETPDRAGSTYHLSPLSKRPSPGGGPPDYWVEETKEDD